MSMRAGRRDQSIEIEKNFPVDDGYGEPVDDWSLYAAPWASVDVLRGSEDRSGAVRSAVVQYKVTVLQGCDTDGVDADMRVVWRGRYLYIVSPTLVVRETYELICEERTVGAN